MRVSFDFDQTLDRESVQEYASDLLSRGVDVWICTSRFSNTMAPNEKWNDDLYAVCDKLGIERANVIFCGMGDKCNYLKHLDFIWHLDDDSTELDLINKYTRVNGISVWGNNTWKNKCEKLLKI